MKKIFSIILISSLWTSCNNVEKKFEYGSNNGKLLEINGKKIYYEEYGQGTPLLLLSGGGLSRSIKDFEKCIPELAKHFRVIAPDTPGQGRSEQADTTSYPVLLEFMSQFIDSLKVDSVYVMGWSDGGITGILLAEKRPDKVKKVVAVGANNGLRRAISAAVPIDAVQPMPVDESINQYMNKLPRDWKKLLNELNKMWYQKDEYFSDSIYGQINIPVMIVLGDRDDIIPEHGLAMHKLIKGSQFCVLPNTSHDVFAERPDIITKISMDFFK
jgi:pimeloyl-ACP methyl ester carboxylesterase